jgi:hypothetical protein
MCRFGGRLSFWQAQAAHERAPRVEGADGGRGAQAVSPSAFVALGIPRRWLVTCSLHTSGLGGMAIGFIPIALRTWFSIA